jgi:hypothetical protein
MSDRISPRDPTSHDGRVRPERLRGMAMSCGCTALLLLGLAVPQNVRAEPNEAPGVASSHASGLPQGASDMTDRMRAIVADPAIRDFAGPAENAFDFAKPDGVPGFGPMRPTDDLDQLHAQATGRPAAPQPGAPPLPGIARAGR